MLVLVPAAVLFGLIAVAGVFAMLLSEDTTEAVASIHDDGKSPETNNPANHSSIGGTPQRGTDGFQPDSRGSSQESVALVSQDGGTGRSASNNRLEEGTDFGFPAPGQGTRGTGTAGSGSTSGSTFGQPRGSFSLPAPGDTPFDPPQSPVRANPDGLLAHWPLDDDSGELIRETVGGFHGKLYGKFLPAPGKVGQSLVFNGFSDYISVPGFQVAVDEVTCCAWVYRTKTGAWTGLLTGDGHVLGFSQYGKTVCYHWPSPAKVHSWPGPVVPNDEWIFVAVAIEPTKATAYLWSQGTGLQSKVNAVAHPSHNLDNLEIGRQNLENDSYFSGRLDDIRIYSRALTEVEIQALVDTAG